MKKIFWFLVKEILKELLVEIILSVLGGVICC